MKVSLLTLGCRVNQSESSVIEGTLREHGATIVGLHENPDYCIVNTCTVTAKSDYNSRQLIRRAAKAGSRVIVTGCYSQLKSDIVTKMPGVTDIIDIRNKHKIPDIITGDKTVPHFGHFSRSRPFLKVQDGCNFSCTYCSVPLARGRSTSIPLQEVVESARQIDLNGYKEIVLTGIHLGTYGHDLPGKENIATLLKNILKHTEIPRIRLSSLEINEFSDELVELLCEERVCNHFHVPLQSGSNRILKLMNRKYRTDFFIKKIHEIASRVNNISLGTDIIVGFPEEKDKDFEKTHEMLRELPFTYLHVFPFSPRPDTAAFNLSNRPDGEVTDQRLKKLLRLSKQKKNEYMQKQISRVLDVIVEEKNSENIITGTSRNYLKMRSLSRSCTKGSLVNIRSLSIVNDMLVGDAVD